MDLLLEDYKRKLKTAEKMLDNEIYNSDVQRKRIETKKHCYRTMITDIERAQGRILDASNNTLPIDGVNARFSSENELRTFIQMHIPIAVRPTKPAKTMFVSAFTSANAEKIVVDSLVEYFLNWR